MLLCSVLVLVLLSTLIVPASAAYPVGTVNSWYSDASNVGYAKVGGSYAVSSQSNDARSHKTFSILLPMRELSGILCCQFQ